MTGIDELTELVLSDDFRKLAEARDVFCPFEALKASRTEIRHSNFLASILDPISNHGFGEAVLRQMLDLLFATSGESALRLELAVSDIGRVEVFRELEHMDIVISLPDLGNGTVVIIELKVDAKEHGNQLETYEEKSSKLWPGQQRLYYLISPDGFAASRPNWHSVDFEKMAGKLEAALTGLAGDPLARGLLKAYVDLLRRLFVPNDELEALARKLWTKHGQTLAYLMDQRPSAMRDISAAIQSHENIAAMVSDIEVKTGIRVQADNCSNTYLRFFVPAWAKNPNMVHGDFSDSKHLLVIEIEFYADKVHARFLLGRGDLACRKALYEQLVATPKVGIGKTRRFTDQWTRLTGQVIKKVNVLDDHSDQEMDELVKAIGKGIVTFVSQHLPAYDKAVRGV